MSWWNRVRLLININNNDNNDKNNSNNNIFLVPTIKKNSTPPEVWERAIILSSKHMKVSCLAVNWWKFKNQRTEWVKWIISSYISFYYNFYDKYSPQNTVLLKALELTVNRAKYFWLPSPTQLLTHGQWWSIFFTHLPHTLQKGAPIIQACIGLYLPRLQAIVFCQYKIQITRPELVK